MNAKMREISTLASVKPGFVAHAAAVLAAALLAGCASDAPLTTGAEAASFVPPSSAAQAAEKSPAEAAEDAELIASAAEVPVVAGGPRLVCRREIPIGSRIGHEVCTMEGGPRTAADELQDIQTDFELEENRLDQLINLGTDDQSIQGASGGDTGGGGGP